MTIRLGVIGLSEGNGHPYSWSAIINGYSPEAMALCEFPVIPRYLAEQKWPDARIKGAHVTHIWTQSQEVSRRVAAASLIANVVEEPEDMIGDVDAILLARDDAENHLRFASPFILAGLPIYIDKPIACSMDQLNRLYALRRYEWQIFTCSALRYARELMVTPEVCQRIGRVRHIQAVTPKSWKKYAVHIIEPILKIIGNHSLVEARPSYLGGSGSTVLARFESGVTAEISAVGDGVVAPISIRLFGDSGWHDLIFEDSFSAFRAALVDFLDGIVTKTCRSPLEFNERVVAIIEAGATP